MMITNTEVATQLGKRLRQARIEARETQEDFGFRIGVSRHVIIKMEKGDASVSLGTWLAASEQLGLLDTWGKTLVKPPNPFEEFDRKQKKKKSLESRRVRKKGA